MQNICASKLLASAANIIQCFMSEIEVSERTGLNFKCPESTTLESNLRIQVLSLTSDTAINLFSCLEQVILCQDSLCLQRREY